jgi:branched-chain amino acid transport system ATP-binding protein
MLLETANLNAGYGFLHILRDVSLKVDEGEFVCLIGPNGAGKSTTLRTIAGLIRPYDGRVSFRGQPINGLAGHRITQLGVSYISEAMNLFTNMTVHENLMMGAYTIRDKAFLRNQLDFVYSLFPRLEERRNQLSGTMSGGERKMLAIARGLMSNPKMVLVDEPSFGLSPLMTKAVFEALDLLNRERGLTILVVEQNVTLTLAATNRGYVIENGRIVLEGPSPALAADEYVRRVFLGI